ncbi:hypothetical protein, partial [Bacillus wiedmannii]|uniref:hypothetical protein n=1 Tax=Bacillus wiedmannii TaxID=1890302 RepID=UPI000BFB0430
IDMRRKRSLISWVLSMSIVDVVSKRKLHKKKMKPVRVYLACLNLITESLVEAVLVQMNKS